MKKIEIEIENDIRVFFSESRLLKYENILEKTELSLTEKYILNKELSESFLGEIALFEIFIRNAIAEVIIQKYTRFGFFHSTFFNSLKHKQREDVMEVLKKIDSSINCIKDASQRNISQGLLISRLGLRFWINFFDTKSKLMDKKNFSLLFPMLKNLNDSQRLQKIQEIFKQSEEIVTFRNRVCHHEVILNNKYENIHANMINIINYFGNSKLDLFFKEHSNVEIIINKIKSITIQELSQNRTT